MSTPSTLSTIEAGSTSGIPATKFVTSPSDWLTTVLSGWKTCM